MIKGTKEGLTLHLNDSSSFQDILKELSEKLSVSYRLQKDDPQMKVNVHTGNRLLLKEEEEQLITIIQSNNKLEVERIYSNVILKEEADRLMNESEIKSVVGMIRSGQVLEAPGDMLIIGDVNPGAVVKAAGNIFVLGTLKGSVHAGCNGNTDSIVAASTITSAQISIAHVNTTTAASALEASIDLHSAFLNEQDEIVFDRIQVLKQLRPNLTRLEGGL